MDTKSRSIKYSYGMKVTAFLLAAAFVLSSAWCCVEITKMLHDFGWENLLVRENAGFTDTQMFYNEFATAAQHVKNGPLAHSWEEECAEKYGTLEEEQKLALEQFYAFKDSKEKEARKRYAYTAVADTDADAIETTAAQVTKPVTTDNAEAYEDYNTDAAQEYLNNCSKDFHLKYFPSAGFTFEYTMTEEEVLQCVENSYTTTLTAAKRSFESSTVIAKERTSDYVNFFYLAINSQTGKVVSNSTAKTPDEFYRLMTPSAWTLGCTAEQGLVYYSDAVSVDMLYNTQIQYAKTQIQYSYECLPDYLGEAFGDAGWDIYLSVDMPVEEGDAFYMAASNFYTTTDQLEYLLVAAIILLGAAMLLSIYLVLVTGRVRDKEGVQMSALDNIPTDVHLILSWGLVCLGIVGAGAGSHVYVFDNTAIYYIRNVSLLCLGIALICAVVYALLMEWITSVAKYGKAHKPYFKSMLIYRAGVLLFKITGKGFALLRSGTKKVKGALFYRFKHMTKKTCLFVLCYVAVNAVLSILLATAASFFAMVGLFGFNLVVLILVWRHLTALDKIMDAAEKSKTGEMPQDIGASIMPEPLQSLAKNLTFTQEEMQKAVSEAVKGERMKTELITNVSHDLKTPLTSIISYVDLLKKCDIDDIDAQKYITVLDEKSIRLKRLIEDLVEASKASSGAVTLNKMQVNLYELAVQAIGEMEDSFTAQDLQIVLNEPSEAPVVFVDSQKTWRVIDNLLNNARKYSLGGSRVYVDVAKQGDCGTFVIKNISGEALNIDPDELTQRFVRGDSSRTREGSGLGLSIAKDLCILQGGALKIEIDGDLFKATVSLPLANGTFPINKPAQQ